MAGFFGLFDYSKAGPGVSKNGPQKNAVAKFFELYVRKFWKLIVANLIYVVTALPLVTSGLASVGLTYVTRNFVREKHAFVYGDFVDTVKKNWKQALPVGIINLLLTALLVADIIYFDPLGIISAMVYTMMGRELPPLQEASMGTTLMTAVIFFAWLIFSFMKYYIYLMMVTFKFKVTQIYKNSVIFAFAGMWRNISIFLFMGVIYAAAIFIALLHPIGSVVALFGYVFLFPAFKSFLIQYATFPLIKKHIIDPYYKEHPDEDKEAKRALNIDDNSVTEEDDGEERVFEDMGETAAAEEEEKPKSTFPRQYSQQEMDRLRSKQKSSRSKRNDSDDDGTI